MPERCLHCGDPKRCLFVAKMDEIARKVKPVDEQTPIIPPKSTVGEYQFGGLPPTRETARALRQIAKLSETAKEKLCRRANYRPYVPGQKRV